MVMNGDKQAVQMVPMSFSGTGKFEDSMNPSVFILKECEWFSCFTDLILSRHKV